MHPTITIDLNWMGHPRSIASALLRSQHSRALVDPGPATDLPALRAQLAAQGLQVSDLNAILLTHIHLDHAGATGLLVRENPQLQIFVHEKGAPHMSDPAKLLQSASRLYGEDMQRLFGEFLPVPEANLQILRGGEVLDIAGRRMHVLYTPGHASHHLTYFDPEEGVAFVGDTGGICINGHPFILPATPPPDISLELWDASLDAIANLQPNRLFLTHFAFSDHPARHIATYRDRLHYWSERTASILAGNFADRIEICGQAKKMDGNDSAGLGGNCRFKSSGGKVKGLRIDVHKDRLGAGASDRTCRGYKCEGRSHHFVAWAHA
jgi:glyoxylase-like metal-dependent hydrolase (beta-lactamase superfamily II)